MTEPQPEPTDEKVVPLRAVNTTTRQGEGGDDPQHTSTSKPHPEPEPEEQPETGLVPVNDGRMTLPELYRRGAEEDMRVITTRPKQAWLSNPASLQTVHSWVHTSYAQSPVPILNGIRVAYGYFAVAVTALLYTAAWVVQRDYRLAVLLVSTAATVGAIWLLG